MYLYFIVLRLLQCMGRVMENNPFEAGSNKKQDQFKGKKENKFSKVFFIIIGIILVVALYKGPISNKIEEIKLNRLIEEGLAEKDANNYFQGNLELLGQGTATLLSSATEFGYSSPRFIDDGTVYYYDEIDPGVYTVEFVQGNNLVFGGDEYFAVGYEFGQEEHDAVINELENVTIKDGDLLFVECESGTDFELKLTPQDEYLEFDSSNITPGVYTVGINIEPGTYGFSSKDGNAVNLVVSNSATNSVISSDEYDGFTLEEGDFIIIDDEDTLIELQ